MKIPQDLIPAVCFICGKQYPLSQHTLHIIARHWKWVEALHNKSDLIETADAAGV